VLSGEVQLSDGAGASENCASESSATSPRGGGISRLLCRRCSNLQSEVPSPSRRGGSSGARDPSTTEQA